MTNASHTSSALTPREAEIIAMLADGDIGKTIAAKLGLSHRTVETHILNLRKALGAKTIAHAVSIWMREKAEADRVQYLGLYDAVYAPVEEPIGQSHGAWR